MLLVGCATVKIGALGAAVEHLAELHAGPSDSVTLPAVIRLMAAIAKKSPAPGQPISTAWRERCAVTRSGLMV
jgi:hypothetical protein